MILSNLDNLTKQWSVCISVKAVFHVYICVFQFIHVWLLIGMFYNHSNMSVDVLAQTKVLQTLLPLFCIFTWFSAFTFNPQCSQESWWQIAVIKKNIKDCYMFENIVLSYFSRRYVSLCSLWLLPVSLSQQWHSSFSFPQFLIAITAFMGLNADDSWGCGSSPRAGRDGETKTPEKEISGEWETGGWWKGQRFANKFNN